MECQLYTVAMVAVALAFLLFCWDDPFKEE